MIPRYAAIVMLVPISEVQQLQYSDNSIHIHQDTDLVTTDLFEDLTRTLLEEFHETHGGKLG